MMRDLYEPLLGLAPSVVIGLPISMEMFGAFLSSLLIGQMIDLKGWRPAFLLGLAVFGAGTVLSGSATAAVPFILARGVTGLGYGAAWMGLRGLVAAGATGASRNRGFSFLNAGIFAGQSCGAVLGAMLAERRRGSRGCSSWPPSALVLVTAAFALLLMRNVRPAATGAARVGFEQTRAFFADRSLIAFLLLVTIPSAVCGMFLNYFLPVYAKSAGIAQGHIGRTFLAYGVCIIYVGPLLIQRLGRLRSRRVMALASLLGASALGLFCLRASFATAVAGGDPARDRGLDRPGFPEQLFRQPARGPGLRPGQGPQHLQRRQEGRPDAGALCLRHGGGTRHRARGRPDRGGFPRRHGRILDLESERTGRASPQTWKGLNHANRHP